MRHALPACLVGLALAAPAPAEESRGRGHLSFPNSTLQCVAISAEHKYVALGFKDGSISLIELADKPKDFQIKNVPSSARPVTAVAFSPGTEWLLSAAQDGTVKLWPAIATSKAAESQETASLARPSRSVAMQTAGVTCLAVSPDGKTFAAGGADGTVRLATLPTGKAAGKFTAHKGAVHAVAFDADGTRLATAGADKTAKVWSADGDDWKQAAVLEKNAGPVLSVAWSPDGKRLATAGGADKKPGELKLWDAATGKELTSVPGIAETVTGVAFHPKLDRLICCGKDRTVRVRDSEKGDELYSDAKHKDAVRQVAVSADGVMMLSASPEMMAFWQGSPEVPKK